MYFIYHKIDITLRLLHALRQVAYLFNKVILCVQRHAIKFVQVYANPFICKRI